MAAPLIFPTKADFNTTGTFLGGNDPGEQSRLAGCEVLDRVHSPEL